MATFGLPTRSSVRWARTWAFWRPRRTTPFPGPALVEPATGWEPLPLDVAEWMGLNPYAPREPRSA
jgi:hypothetical protein